MTTFEEVSMAALADALNRVDMTTNVKPPWQTMYIGSPSAEIIPPRVDLSDSSLEAIRVLVAEEVRKALAELPGVGQ